MKKRCRICGRPEKCRKLCNAHYRRWRRHGNPFKGARKGKVKKFVYCIVKGCKRRQEYKGRCSHHFAYQPPKYCTIPKCNNSVFVGSMCKTHYWRIEKGGRTDLVRRVDGTGSISTDGYVQICKNGKRYRLHRYLMEQYLGRVLERREFVHHKDHNKLNNTLDNLQIMLDGEHSRHHNRKWTPGGKTCTRCHKFKPLTDFYCKVANTYYSSMCRCCSRYHKSKTLRS